MTEKKIESSAIIMQLSADQGIVFPIKKNNNTCQWHSIVATKLLILFFPFLYDFFLFKHD